MPIAEPTGILSKPLTTIEDFASRYTSPLDGCWNWTGRLANGYGYFHVNGKYRKATRVLWELMGYTVTPEQELDHLCHNPTCIRPSHLDPVSHRENLMRSNNFAAIHARQTHCKRGHEFTAENIYFRKDQPYGRRCRRCEVQRIRSKP